MLNDTQKTTLAASIAADPAFAGLPHNSDGAYEIAAAYNLPASPGFVVWKTRVTLDEILQNGFTWTQVDNLSPGEARIWEWMFGNDSRALNAAKSNIRAGIDEAWKGTAAKLAVRAAVYVHCKRPATRAEAVFATGTGSDASPGTMGYEGILDYFDIQQALGW